MKLMSAYLCVHDMDRAISFYEKLFHQSITEYDCIYSVFQLGDFRLGLYAYEKNKEAHHFGNNCLLSIEVDSLAQLQALCAENETKFPLTKIKQNWVCEIMDSEGNQIELTTPV